jgi:hypothetical protein
VVKGEKSMDWEEMFSDMKTYFSRLYDDTADEVETNFDRGVGFVVGKTDSVLDNLRSDVAVAISPESSADKFVFKAESSPLYTAVRAAFGLMSPSEVEKMRGIDDQIKILRDNLNNIESSQGGTVFIDSETVEALTGKVAPGGEYSKHYAQDIVSSKLNQLEGTGLEATEAKAKDYVEPMLHAAAGLSPILVGLAGLKPRYMKELLGLHLVADTSLGLLNFRGNRPEGYGVVKTLSPYVTMLGLGLSNMVGGQFR